jgi:hypothetical protein
VEQSVRIPSGSARWVGRLQRHQTIGFQLAQELFHIPADGAPVAFELILQVLHEGLQAEWLGQQGPDPLTDRIEGGVAVAW